MKPLLIFLLIGFSLTAGAQDLRYDFKIKKGQSFNLKDSLVLKQFFNNQISKSNIIANSGLQQEKRYLGKTKLGNLYALPLDNMPCIVPDLSGYKKMPNGASDYLLKNPIDPGIYFRKPYRVISKVK